MMIECFVLKDMRNTMEEKTLISIAIHYDRLFIIYESNCNMLCTKSTLLTQLTAPPFTLKLTKYDY